jgi:VWFA-related protein
MSSNRLLLAGFMAVALFAQQEDLPIFRELINIVSAPVTVTQDGQFVSGLEPSNFRLYDNGKPQDIKVDVSFVPISLVVAIQNSANTRTVLPKVAKLGTMLESVVAGEQGEVAIICFDHRIQTLQDFTTNSELVSQGMAKLKLGSQSHRMIDAAMQGIYMLRNRPANRRRVLMMISETVDGSSENKIREVMAAAQFANVIVYPVIINRLVTTLTDKPEPPRPDPFPPASRPLPSMVPATPEAMRANVSSSGSSVSFIPVFVEIFKQAKGLFVANPAEVLSKYTGGREYPFITEKDLQQAIMKVGEEIRSQYTLTYAPNNKMEAGFHEIRVDVVDRSGRTRTDVKVLVKPGYWMAAVPN